MHTNNSIVLRDPKRSRPDEAREVCRVGRCSALEVCRVGRFSVLEVCSVGRCSVLEAACYHINLTSQYCNFMLVKFVFWKFSMLIIPTSSIQYLVWRVGLVFLCSRGLPKDVLPVFQVEVLLWTGDSGSNPERAHGDKFLCL